MSGRPGFGEIFLMPGGMPFCMDYAAIIHTSSRKPHLIPYQSYTYADRETNLSNRCGSAAVAAKKIWAIVGMLRSRG